MLPPNQRKKENEIDRNSPLGGDLNIAAVLSTSVPLSSSLSLSVSSSPNTRLGRTILKNQPWFSCTISSTFCKSSATWALLSEQVLSKAWYLQPHLSTSLCSAAPAIHNKFLHTHVLWQLVRTGEQNHCVPPYPHSQCPNSGPETLPVVFSEWDSNGNHQQQGMRTRRTSINDGLLILCWVRLVSCVFGFQLPSRGVNNQ